MYELTWIEEPVQTGLPIRQVYGFIFDSAGRIFVQDDEGRYNLPGGKPEHGESLLETLIREVLEESQATIGMTEYLGYQYVDGEEVFAQVRFTAILDRLLPNAADPCTGRQYRRLWVPPPLVNGLLVWGDSGDRQVAKAVTVANRMGVAWVGAPLEDADEDEDGHR